MTKAAEPATGMDLPRATMGVLFIVTLIAVTIWVLRPFLAAAIWAAMIVVATWPLFERLQGWLGGSRAWATAALTTTLLLALVLPLSLTIGTIVANAGDVIAWASTLRSFTIPPPPEWLVTLPLIGTPAVNAWQRVTESGFVDLASTAAPYVATAVLWVATTMRGVALLMLQFLLTVAIAAVMYAKGEQAAETLMQFGRRLGGAHGEGVIRLAAQAIRGVALGVVATATIQALLTGIGLLVTGVPFSALFGAIAFVLCIAQVGPFLVLAPSVAWLYWQDAPTAATVLLVWAIVVQTLDNFLRPVLMTKGANLPMLLMFAGVIGGLLAFGLIGIFVGPVVLAISYTLLRAWIGISAASMPEKKEG
jgi:predicted PurR-regulated permease PerM